MLELFHALAADDLDSVVQFFEDHAIHSCMFSMFPPGASCFGTKPIPALNVALAYNAGQCVEFLMECGADIDEADGSGHRAVHAAAACGNPAILELLAANGCDIAAPSHNGSEPIHIAAAAGQIPAVEWLLDSGSGVDCRNACLRTPLLIASAGNSIDLIRLLILRGADITAVDDMGNTAIHIALSRRKYEIARYFVSLRAISLNAANFEGITFPMIACQLGDLELLQYLLGEGASASALDRNGRSILHHAIAHRKIELVSFILDENVVDAMAMDYVRLIVIKFFLRVLMSLPCILRLLHALL
jgi:ankyrin repeat protein